VKAKKVSVKLHFEADDVEFLKKLAFQFNIGNLSEDDVLEAIQKMIAEGKLHLIGINIEQKVDELSLANRVYEVVRDVFLKCAAENKIDWFADEVEKRLKQIGLENVEAYATAESDEYIILFSHEGTKYIAFVDESTGNFELCRTLLEKKLR